MATQKEFLDQEGVEYLWKVINDLLAAKANEQELSTLQDYVDDLSFLTEAEDTIEVYGGSAEIE